MYAHRIDVARKAVAIAMVVCSVGVVVCIRRDDYLTGTLKCEPGIWRSGANVFTYGILACLIATAALVVEYLARRAVLSSFSLQSFFVSASIILAIIVASGVLMTFGFGVAQGVGAVIGTILLLAAMRERREARAVLAVLAAVVLGPTLLSTQSTYQYARRNAGEIVTAGCELMDQWFKTDFGHEVPISDTRVPKAFHSLGVRRVWIDEDRMSVFVPGLLGLSDREFIICRDPPPTTIGSSVWINRKGFSKDYGMIRINDQLWMTDY
jgi:hypothetical protein